MVKWLESDKNFLVLLGPPGTGKTHFCASLVDYAIRRCESRRYWNAGVLLAYLRTSLSQYSDCDVTLVNGLDDHFCMIDDIGSTSVKDWRTDIIFTAIDIRYNSTLPTVITSNLNKLEIKQIFAERTADRLFAKENTVIDLFDMVSLR